MTYGHTELRTYRVIEELRFSTKICHLIRVVKTDGDKVFAGVQQDGLDIVVGKLEEHCAQSVRLMNRVNNDFPPFLAGQLKIWE